jgi:hypothetical protein
MKKKMHFQARLPTASPQGEYFVPRHFMRVSNQAQLIQKIQQTTEYSRGAILRDLVMKK